MTPERTWLPEIYQDESIPAPRKSPNDWVVTLPGDAYALAPAYDDDDGEALHILRDGDVVLFDWNVQLGEAMLTIDDDQTWTVSRPMPAVPDADTFVMAVFDWETVTDNLDDLVRFELEFQPELRTIDVIYVAWSQSSVRFVFRAGQFVEAPAGSPA